ncbi:MAG: carboxypeptidase regulatory-like domain-containing protein [Planctomycetes bacterium]|nr:carboxypeptidase regulatory-like domain-containing protein [Planctomycetota bacterium]
MEKNRIALLVGLLLLVVIALGIGWFLLNPPAGGNRPADTTALDRSGETNKQGRAASGQDSTPANASTGDGQGTRPDANKGQPDVEVVPAVPTKLTVSGTAVDFFDEPASGITLTLLPEDGATASGSTSVTDDAGVFTFEVELLVGKGYFVACLEEGKALTATETFVVKEETPVEGLVIRIYAAARAYGVVLNGADQSPLPDVSIELDARADEKLRRLGRILGRFKPVKSDAQGKFEMESIAPGAYLVYARKQGWMSHELNPLTRSRQEMELDEFANFELLPFVLVQAGGVEGYVLKRSDNSPIVGATVELGTVLGGTLAVTSTDATGFYKFDQVPPGIGAPGGEGDGMGGAAVRAIAAGYAIATRDLRVRSGQVRKDVNLLLEDGAGVTGRVVDTKQQGIAGAQVYYNDNDFLRGGEWVAGISIPPRTISATTDEQGNFALTNLPVGSVGISAKADGFGNKTVQATTTAGNTAEIVIVLEPAGWIEGTVVNDQGVAVQGVPLAAYDVSGPGQLAFVMKSFFGETLPDRGESTLFPSSIRSDENGAFRIDNLPAGKYVLLANTRNYQKYISAELEVKTGAGTVHNVRLEVGGTIFGRVYDSYSKAVPGVPVTCASLMGQDSARIRTAYTDGNGNYELTGLTPGTYTVVRNTGNMAALLLPNPSTQVKVAAGERVEFDIYDQKPGTARLYGRVTEDGKPYAEKQIVLIGGNRGGFAANTTRTDKQGNYEFRSVALGTYQIAQQGQGPAPSLVRKRVHVDKDGDFEFDVAFVTVKITGRVELEGGKVPEGRVRVMASPVSPDGADKGDDDEAVNEMEMLVFRETNADEKTGAFELTGMSPGFYRLTVRSDKNGMVTRPYLNLRNSVAGLVITLPAEGASLKGTVTGVDGAPNNTPFGLIAALTIEDERGQPLSLGGFDNGVNLTESKSFEVKNLAEGKFTITLSLPGYTPVTHSKVEFKAGQAVSLTFAFAASGNLKIRLLNTDLNIQTAMGLEYEIRNSKDELFKKRFTFLDFFNSDGSATQGEDNSFTIKDLPPESYTISMTMPGYKAASREFTIVAGQTAEISVEFEKE